METILEKLRAIFDDPLQVIRFGVVGISGVGVNTFFLWFFTEIAGFYYLVSSPLAVELAVISNFLLNNAWTFRETSSASGMPARMMKFHAISAVGFLINYAVLISLTELAGLYYLVSNLIGIVAAFAWNYSVNVRWTWRKKSQAKT